MYFTEHGEPREGMVALEEELRAQYDEEEYEKKIAQVMAGGCRRPKEEGSEPYRTWNAALQELRKGDYYLLVSWDRRTIERSPYDFLEIDRHHSACCRGRRAVDVWPDLAVR
jgi:hypothetical protein